MSFFGKIAVFLMAKSQSAPQVFGLYHIGCILVCIAVTVLLCVFFRDSEEKIVRRIALIMWIVTIVFELYKEIFYLGYDLADGKLVWDYDWYGFPFQFCSCIIFLLPIVAFMKESKFRDAVIMFLGTFSVFAGLCNYVYPEQVFVRQIGISIQTMVHHGIQVAGGIFFMVHRRNKLSLKGFLWGAVVFAGMCAVATLLNEVFYYAFIKDLGETFNMFFISRHFDCTLPVLSIFYPLVPYVIFVLIYLVGFTLAAIVIYYAIVGIYLFVKKLMKKEGANA